MNEFRLQMSKFKSIVIRKDDGENVFTEIKRHLANDELVIIDFSEIETMTTYFAKQVFGRLYVEMGPDNFSKRIKFVRMSSDVELVIKIGIAGAISRI
jgi:hypothetical protein